MFSASELHDVTINWQKVPRPKIIEAFFEVFDSSWNESFHLCREQPKRSFLMVLSENPEISRFKERAPHYGPAKIERISRRYLVLWKWFLF